MSSALRKAGLPSDASDVSWWLAPGETAAALGGLLEAAAKIPRGGSGNLKSGRRKELHRFQADGRRFLVKINHYDSSVSRLRRLRESKARREFRIARALFELGITTPLPVAVGERRNASGLEACYLVVPVLEGATDLATLWRGKATPAARRAWSRELGRVARRVHDVGLLQDDFAPNNFLVYGEGLPGEAKMQLLPIDFERASLSRTPVRQAARVRMLATLDRHLMGASTAARLRLLTAYFAGDRAQARAYWQAIAAAAPSLTRRDFAHIRRTYTKESRRNRRFTAGEGALWSGWARSDAKDLGAVERDLAEAPRFFSKLRSDAQKTTIENRSVLWRIGTEGFGERRAQRVWAVAQWLWMRGELAPKPVAMLRRGRQTLLWFERNVESQRLDSRIEKTSPDTPSAERAGRALLRRLAALGRFKREIQPHGISVQLVEGRWRAQLLDVTCFLPGGSRFTPDAGTTNASRDWRLSSDIYKENSASHI